MKSYVIGLDYGSDSVRALLVDAADGHELATAVAPYPRWSRGEFCDAENHRFRQHPLDYLECLESVVKAVLAKVPPEVRNTVRGIGIDTTGSTPCAVDAAGTPLAMLPEFAADPDAMFVLWKDHTAAAEADRINEYARTWGGTDFTRYEGGIYSPEWFWSKILHILRRNPAVRRAAYSWVEHCDWIVGELVGKTRPGETARSRCAAGHKAMWHEDWGGLPPEEFLAGVDPLLAGLRDRLYRHTVTADTRAGTLTPDWSRKLGLPDGVAVAAGGFDAHFGAVGAGITPGTLVKVVGTSTCDMLVASGVSRCVRGICGQVDGSIVPGLVGLEAGQSAFGDIYAHFKRLLLWPLESLPESERRTVADALLPELEKAAARLAPGAGELLAIDWHNGRRTPDADARLTGAVFGLNLGSTAPMVFRALVESTVFGARRIVERFREEGIAVDRVIAIGGIAGKSPLVMQICADVLNCPIQVSDSAQSCALGAAIFGAVAAGLYPDAPEAMRAMAPGCSAVYRPEPGTAALYDQLYAKYRRYADALEKLVHMDKELA